MTDLDARRAAMIAASMLAEIGGKPVVGVLSVRRSDGDGWEVELELVEDSHIPSSRDLLGSYSVELDAAGDLVGFRQVRRYVRGSANGGAQ